jgi:Rrf2 family nitric oxide-sensitive transcriptional repressor
MRLTNYSDYALRTLMYLAVMPEDAHLATIQDIADSYQISKSHLTKIIHQLAQLGYIESIRGKNGGIRLAKRAEAINLGEVLRHTEPDFAIVPCFVAARQSNNRIEPAIEKDNKVGQVSCMIQPNCLLKKVFYEATQAFITVMDSYTLADITQNGNKLWALLR